MIKHQKSFFVPIKISSQSFSSPGANLDTYIKLRDSFAYIWGGEFSKETLESNIPVDIICAVHIPRPLSFYADEEHSIISRFGLLNNRCVSFDFLSFSNILFKSLKNTIISNQEQVSLFNYSTNFVHPTKSGEGVSITVRWIEN